MRCSHCGIELADDEARIHHNETLCEDCYLDTVYSVKGCDPWAVYLATRSRQAAGQKGSEGLTDLQREIYEFIKERGKVTGEELLEHFGLPLNELQDQIAILRHCELVKGLKEGARVFLTLFEQD